MAKNKRVTVGYWYSLGWHSVLCQGGADAIEEIRYAGRVAWQGNVTNNTTIFVNRADLLGGEKREGGVEGFVDIMFGEDTQQVNQYLAYQSNVSITPVLNDNYGFAGGWNAWSNSISPGAENSYLVSNGGRPVPAYRGVVSMVFRSFTYAAMNPYLKDMSIRVRRLPRTLNNTTFDIYLDGVHHANPAHIIYEVLTNRLWGMGFLPEDIDVASFVSAAATLHAEGFGLSLAWTDEGTAEDFINLIKSHINAVVYPAPDTGRYTMKLVRGDYNVASLFVASPENIVSLRSFQRASPTDLVNEVTIEYHDMQQDKPVKITVSNLAGIQSTGRVVRKVISLPGIRNNSLAARVAQRELMTLSSPLAKAVIDLNASAWNLRPGDAFVLSWPKMGIQQIVMRAVEIEYPDVRSGTITVIAVEDSFGLPASSFITPPVPDWVAPVSGLSDVSAHLLMEIPYYVLIQSNGEDFSSFLSDNRNYLGVIAGRASTLWQNVTLHELIGAEYVELSASTFSPWLVASSEIPKSINDTTVTYDAFFDDSEIRVGDIGIVNAEWVRVQAVNTVLRTVTLQRAILDTVPASHAAGSRIWVFGENFLEDYSTERFATETVTVKLVPETPSETLPIASAVARNYTFVGRQQRPYPPANFRLNGSSYPTGTSGAVTFSWSHRDRLQQTAGVIGQSTGNIGPEAGVTYNLRLYNGPVLIQSYTGLTGTSVTHIFSDVLQLLHFGGANASTTFTDEKGANWTPTGNAQLSTAQKVFGNAAAYFDGSGDYITSPLITLGALDYTLEFWVRPNALSLQVIASWSAGTTQAALYTNAGSGVLRFQWGGADRIVSASPVLAANTWAHIAVVRSSGTHTVYVNGASIGTVATAVVFAEGPVTLARRSGSSNMFAGYIDEYRLSSVARYSAPFTPATAPFGTEVTALLHFNDINGSTNIVDDGGNPWTANGGAVISTAQSVFGGSSLRLRSGFADYLSTPNAIPLVFGINDFTIEYRVRHDDFAAGLNGANQCHVSKGLSNWAVLVSLTGQIMWYSNATLLTTTLTMTANTWHHIAISRSSGVLRIFIDGALGGSIADTNDYSGTSDLLIGASIANGAGFVAGYMDEFRIMSGVAVYTAPFVPVNSPFSASGGSYVSSLLHFDATDASTIFLDEKGKTWAPIGTAQIRTAQSRFGGSSAFFDGTGAYIQSQDDEAFYFATNDFTFEAWVRPEGYGDYRTIFGKWLLSTGYSYLFGLDSTGRVRVFIGGGLVLTTTTTVPLNAWTHVAIVRQAGNVTVYINGVSSGTAAYASGINSPSNSLVCIGACQSGTHPFLGYIDEARIVNGVAMYSGNFTPPEAALFDPFVGSENTTLTVRAELESVRAGLTSYQKHEHEFTVTV